MRPSRSLATAAIAVVGALAVGGCLPAPATREGEEVRTLYAVFAGLGIVIAFLVWGLTTFAAVRYRARGRRTLPEQGHGHLGLEVLWTLLPIATVVVLFGATLLVVNRIESTAANPGASIRVEAFRWGWAFRYPEAGVTVTGIGLPGPEVVIPAGEPVVLTLTSPDVIHSFFVPEFLYKRDIVPGRENVIDFVVEEPGTYRGQCAEFCGIYHARMPFSVRVVERAEYDAWLAAQPRDAEPEAAP